MARRPATPPEPTPARHLLREAEAITGGAIALFLVFSLFSYAPGVPRDNLGGPLGHALAGGLLRALGVAAYLFPIYLVFLTIALLRRSTNDLGVMRIVGAALLVGSVAALGGLSTGGRATVSGGGWLGGFVGTALGDVIGTPGAFLMLGVMLLVALVLATGLSALELATRLAAWGRDGVAAARGGLEKMMRGAAPRERSVPVALVPKMMLEPGRGRRGGPIRLLDAIDDDADEADLPEPRRLPPIILEPERKPEPARRERGRKMEGQEELFAKDAYKLPVLSLLDEPVRNTAPLDEAALHASSRILETKLADFGVAGKVVAVRPGPVITTFEFEPAPGVKVSRIVNLADDMTMALRAASVRILAPIPGKPVVGVEVSNPRRETVFIRDLLQSDSYRSSDSKLTLAIGKDTTGNVVVADLAKMPHLLIAGATGTGKSVSMNAMIMSVLFKASPRDLRMIMIDPKMLELSTYENIPHLLVPVVTDPKKAAAALNNMVREMEDRYRLLHEKGVRNLDSYNRLVARELEEREQDDDEDTEAAGEDEVETALVADDPEQVDLDDEDGDEAPAARPSSRSHHRPLPRVVVIIDELADLMLTVGHEIEEAITRLAQKARAAGIHLILATQRPSVDVITGLIKANFPARISFQVTSGTNSRTILDCIGAERLLGNGDMLYLPPGTARVQRVHGAFVSDEDVHRVVDFIKRQEQPRYEMELLEGGEEEETADPDAEDMSDEMYDMAVRLVTEHRQASISWLQRRLRVGYNRAARMIERMEREGVVSAAVGAKGREVLARDLGD
jgi:S-DNA-T family DNA segregation ATPase FtsK/SpoIIIE